MIQRMKEGAGRELPGEIDRHKQSTGIDVLIGWHIPCLLYSGDAGLPRQFIHGSMAAMLFILAR
jgi:hypothetical protein